MPMQKLRLLRGRLSKNIGKIKLQSKRFAGGGIWLNSATVTWAGALLAETPAELCRRLGWALIMPESPDGILLGIYQDAER